MRELKRSRKVERVVGKPITIDPSKPVHYKDGGKYLQRLWDNVEKINKAFIRLGKVEDNDFVITFLDDQGLKIEILRWDGIPLEETYEIRVLPNPNHDKIEVIGRNAYVDNVSIATRPMEIADAMVEVFMKEHLYV